MAVNDIYSLDAVFVQSGREWMIGEYYRISTNDATKTPVVIAAALAVDWKITLFDSVLDTMLSDDVDLVATVAQLIYPTSDFGVEQPWTVSSGSVVSPPLPAHTCALFKQTGFAHGRSFQGRVFLSGMPTTFQDDGRVSAVGKTAYELFGPTVFGPGTLAPIGGSPLILTHVNASKKLMALATDPVFSDIQAGTILPQLSTQRNRTVTTSAFAP